MIPLSSPDITEAERTAVQNVLKTPILTSMGSGPQISTFEKGMARLAGRKYAVAVNSGTSALHLALSALGIGKGDEVIVPSFSFIASSNCILYVGASPVFVDIEKDIFNIDPAKIEKVIRPGRTKAILAVDVFGEPAAWDEILRIARKYRLKVIEDSAEAIGAIYKGKKCGGFGDAAIFSFYPNKQMTTGEGGMVLTDDKRIADLCRSMTNQGRKQGKNTWLGHVRLGYNYRMTEMQAALGLAQLKRLPGMLQKRARAASLYSRLLSQEKRVILPVSRPGAKRSWFVYVLMLTPPFTKSHRDRIVKLMAKRGVQCSTYFEPIHLQPFYRQAFGSKLGKFPHTEWVGDRTIALPFSSVLQPQQQHRVIKALQESMDLLS
ncbi:MAG: DegT/DnrJ/EryC1/StrS family aminotransferase [Parcubacteria group bacterium]|nr:DegT/DnrJ/EryC1/StrS family aminotransferase [Parcubacteria group bacterium]